MCKQLTEKVKCDPKNYSVLFWQPLWDHSNAYTCPFYVLMYNILTGDFDGFEENTKSRVPEKAYSRI
jgi:hypothetical protein